MNHIVESTLGRLSGQYEAGVHVFRGIPYAAPPIPPHRFAGPRPMPPWTGIRLAHRFGAQARQVLFPFLDAALADDPGHDATRDYHRGIAFEPIPYDEDCLTLDVWTPALTGRRPVMVWLHGGGFASGAGSWGWSRGDVLAVEQDVVLVTLNHRLNIFGFLCLDGFGGRDRACLPNAGMRDIIAALGWVRDNIAVFGGDPANVTIFGQSGGGMKVSTLMAMPAARGLFHKAIVQSGPFLRAVPRERADDVAGRMLKRLDIAPDRLDRLQQVSADMLLDGFASVREGATGVPRQFGPVVDGDSLPAHPFDPIAPAQSAGVPLLIGATTE
jgi:para-nitrobenzyl esterase